MYTVVDGVYDSECLLCLEALPPPNVRNRHRAAETRPVPGTTVAEPTVEGVSTVSTREPVDLILSSGFLAFANHSGFLAAVEEAGMSVGGVMGTSAGALTGSLYCAGYSPREVARHLSEQAPASLLRPSLAPWQGGVLSLEGVVERLRELLPPTFEDLQREFAVGVVTRDGRHVLIDSGPLPEAVAASAAIPFIFEAVQVPGRTADLGALQDGGVADRIGLRAWRDRRRAQLAPGQQPPHCLVHVITRSSPWSGFDDAEATGEPAISIFRSPKARANFFDLGSFADHLDASKARALPRLRKLASTRAAPGAGGQGGHGLGAAVAGQHQVGVGGGVQGLHGQGHGQPAGAVVRPPSPPSSRGRQAAGGGGGGGGGAAGGAKGVVGGGGSIVVTPAGMAAAARAATAAAVPQVASAPGAAPAAPAPAPAPAPAAAPAAAGDDVGPYGEVGPYGALNGVAMDAVMAAERVWAARHMGY